jgi:hypothetical protein
MAELRRLQEVHETELKKNDKRIAELKAQYLQDFADLKATFEGELKDGLAKGAATIRSLESQLIDANEKNESLERSSTRRLELRSAQMLQEAELAENELRAQLEKAVVEKDNAEQRLAKAEVDKQANIRRTSSVEGSVASLTEEVEALKGTTVAAAKKNEVLMETILSLTERNKALESNLNEVQQIAEGERVSNEKALLAIASNHQEAEEARADMKGKISQQQSTRQEENKELQRALAKAEQRIGRALSENKELQEQRGLLKTQVKMMEEQLRRSDQGPCQRCQKAEQPEERQQQVRKPTFSQQSESMPALPSINQSPGPMLPEGAMRGPLMQQGAMRFIAPKEKTKGPKAGAVKGPNSGTVPRRTPGQGQKKGQRIPGGLDQALRSQGPGPSRRRR